MQDKLLRVLCEPRGDMVREYHTSESLTESKILNWDRPHGSPAEEQELTAEDLQFAVDIFSISGIIGMVLMPRYLEIRVDEAPVWQNVHGAVLGVLAARTVSTEVEIVHSFEAL